MSSIEWPREQLIAHLVLHGWQPVKWEKDPHQPGRTSYRVYRHGSTEVFCFTTGSGTWYSVNWANFPEWIACAWGELPEELMAFIRTELEKTYAT